MQLSTGLGLFLCGTQLASLFPEYIAPERGQDRQQDVEKHHVQDFVEEVSLGLLKLLDLLNGEPECIAVGGSGLKVGERRGQDDIGLVLGVDHVAEHEQDKGGHHPQHKLRQVNSSSV